MVDDGDSAAAAQVKAHAEARIGGMLDQLDAQLASHGREWLLGAAYTAVDPFAMLLCRWTRGFARPARSLPHLGPYLQRVLARPAVRHEPLPFLEEHPLIRDLSDYGRFVHDAFQKEVE